MSGKYILKRSSVLLIRASETKEECKCLQYVHGQTLEEAWDSLEYHERYIICHQLRTICDHPRQLLLIVTFTNDLRSIREYCGFMGLVYIVFGVLAVDNTRDHALTHSLKLFPKFYF